MGDADEQDSFWQLVGAEAMRRLEAGHCFWLSTEGSVVKWLHARLDDGRYIKVGEYKD